MNDDEDCNIRVICRFRPVNKREIAEGGGLAKQLTFPTDKCVEVAPFNGRNANTFHFDKVFYDPSTTQEDIYELAANKSIEDVIKGYNSTIFAYGQTGAGKSFTMFGPDIVVPELKGIIPRSCMHIFQHIANDTEGTEYTIKCSFLEIYKEIVRDLLNPKANGTKGLRVREAPNKGVWVDGLHEAYVTCEEDVLELIKQGETHRATSSTAMNATSSRSHSLFILTLHQKTRDGSTKEGRLNLADLAGSEKVGKTGATGDTLEEAKKINQSLSALGNCINALTKAKVAHVPYRDSKLTHILRESLGGNCKSTLLVACSPHVFNLEETVSTLMFAKRAKTIKNSVKVNKQRSVEELMSIIEKLKKEMMFFKKYIAILEQELEKVKGPNWKDDLPKVARPQKPKSKKEASLPSTPSADSVSSSKPSSSDESDGEDDNESPPDEEERVYSNSAEMSLKLAELQVELKKIKDQSAADINDLKEEVKSLTTDNDEAEAALQTKKEILKERDTQIKDLKSELEAQSQAKAISEEKLQYDIKQLSLKSEEQLEAIQSLSSHNAQLKEKFTNLEQQLDDLSSQKDRLQREHDRLQREKEEINEDLQRKVEHIATLEQSLAHYETTYQTIKDQNLQWENTNKALQAKCETLDGKYSALLSVSRENESKLRVALNSKEFLEKRIADLTADLESLENELDETRGVLDHAQEVKEAVQEAGKERIEELLTQTVPLSDYERIMKEKEKYRSNVSDLKSKLNEERSTVSDLRSELEENSSRYESEKEQLQDSWNSDSQERQQTIELLEAKINELKESKQSKLKGLQSQLEDLTSQHESELSSRQKLETQLEEQYEQNEKLEKLLRRANATAEDVERESKQQASVIQSQTRSLEAQAERIKRLEAEMDESTKDREILQQEIKTALEINIENAKQFEKQLEGIRTEQTRRTVPQNIRVPVNQPENRSIIASIFGIKQYPMLGELNSVTKFGYLLKRSNWLKKWEKRWFVLIKDRLLYFETNNQAARATGEIELEGVRVVPAGEFTGRPNTFGLLHRTRKEYYLQAPNEEEHMDWMRTLQVAGRGGKRAELARPQSANVRSVSKEYS